MSSAQTSARFLVNGQTHDVHISPNRLLLGVLREELGLTGTKRGCDDGSCGACTIIVEGEPMLSCMMLALAFQDCAVTTVEGIAADNSLHPLQEGFCTEGGRQCGYCTPGMIMAAKALLDKNPQPTAEEVRQAIAGNLCRCTAYGKIVEAILKAAEQAKLVSSPSPSTGEG